MPLCGFILTKADILISGKIEFSQVCSLKTSQCFNLDIVNDSLKACGHLVKEVHRGPYSFRISTLSNGFGSCVVFGNYCLIKCFIIIRTYCHGREGDIGNSEMQNFSRVCFLIQNVLLMPF